jgi:hypothetical protein
MASILGRALLDSELVHHRDENASNDAPENLELIDAETHNRHHKIGSRHSDQSKRKTAESVKAAYASGLKTKPVITSRDSLGRISTIKKRREI